jgi:cytochrome b6-f complex iron-sulfur subunit
MKSRRQVIKYFSLATLSGCLPIALAACNPNTPNNQSTLKKGDGLVPIGKLSELDQQGKIKTKDVLVIRNPNNSNELLAVNPTCTHNGCAVDWVDQEKQFVCPCHSAAFSADGKVVKGPATRGLTNYKVKVVDDNIMLDL